MSATLQGTPLLRTDHLLAHPWPAGTFLQGGSSGLVLRRDQGSYATAFVEAFPDGTFIRGEGETVAAAEDAAWAKYQQNATCPFHEYEPRGYLNGAGICRHCERFQSGVFTAEELGLYCDVCGRATMHENAGGKVFCPEHTPTRAERRAMNVAAGTPPSMLEELLDALHPGDDQPAAG